jgi:transposase
VSTVRRWVRQFKDGELGQADLSDKTQSGRPVPASDQLQKLVQCWQKCIEVRGDFVEK